MEKLPKDLAKILAAAPKAKAKWQDLTPIARRDFVSWIESAKQEDTRLKRAQRVPDMLMEGKRRPCCYAVVPMGLYRALGTNAKAKAAWKDLDPNEKRDLSDWVESAKDPKTHAARIEKVLATLSKKK